MNDVLASLFDRGESVESVTSKGRRGVSHENGEGIMMGIKSGVKHNKKIKAPRCVM